MSVADMDQPQMNAGPEGNWFHFSFDQNRWEWSAATAQLHGYRPDEVVPDADLVLSHQHPGDRRSVATTLHEIRRSSRPRSSRHRLVDAKGDLHHVIVVGDPVHDERGAVTGVRGFYVETSAPRDAAREQSLTDAVTEITEARAVIEQAKGMLMVIYRIDADAAFELLKWRSQVTNTKLRALSERIAAAFLAMDSETTEARRPEHDNVLLTAHLRAVPGG
jgi:hypothetical protein